MKKTLFALALAAAPFASFASESNNIGYTYLQLDATYQDTDVGEYPWGAALSGSYAFTDNVFATASISQSQDDGHIYGNEWETTNKSWSLGLGFNQAIGARADWVSKLAYVHKTHKDEWDDADGDSWYWRERLHGYNISTGVLGHVTDKLTANAYLGYEDYNHHYDGNFYADFGMGYAFNPTWSLQGGLKLAENDTIYTVGIRASF